MSPQRAAVLVTVSAVAAPVGLYLLLLLLGSQPFFQRHFLYAHRIHTLWWDDVNEPEQWGFARGQVTPFSLTTPDNEDIYAWHILPLPLYLQHEAKLSQQEPGFCKDFPSTESFRKLKEDPEARVVLYFHGNAGHIAQNHRPKSYHVLTDTSSYHVLAIDYRGYGHSSGSPTEHGLIADAATLVDFVMNTVGIPADRIVLLGQSLGTAVASGVAELYARRGVEFAGIVLVAGFSHLPSMLNGYRISGLVPVLRPLRVFPWLLRWVQSFIADEWHTAERLANIVATTKKRLRLNLIAAKDDMDIPPSETDKLFRAAANATVPGGLDDQTLQAWRDAATIEKGNSGFVTTWKSEPNIIIRHELYPYGGHNNIMGYAPVTLAVMRSFDLEGTGYEV